MKKTVAFILCMALVITCVVCLAACNNNGNKEVVIPDEMTSADGKYEIAMVTDIGQLKDGSFNEGTWNGVKTFAYNNNKSYKYYQPANGANASDQDRIDAFNLAINGGASIIVCPGYAFENALKEVVPKNPNVKFVFIDGWTLGEANLTAVAYHEEQCGYFAGYAAVMEGYTKLGGTFGGGATNAACNRYAYGYLQGINAAAKEKNIKADVRISHQFGSGFSASPELQQQINGWYTSGTQIVFACGGSMSESVFAAAAQNRAKSIGVDVDQSGVSETVVTSAMKGLKESVEIVLKQYFDGEWDTKLSDKLSNLGAKDGAVGLPTATWSMKNYTVDQYNQLLNAVKNGSVEIATCGADWTAVDTAAKAMANINYMYI